jgi:eukaryotic-like serine/threonine-protein kinase
VKSEGAAKPESKEPLPSKPASKQWMFRANLQRTGLYDGRSVDKLTELKWKFKTGGWVSVSPAVTDFGVYFGSLDGFFYLVDHLTGLEKWRFQTGGSIYSSCSIVDSVAFFGSLDGHLYSVDSKSGELRSKFGTGSPIYSSPRWTEIDSISGAWTAIFTQCQPPHRL